MRYESVVVVCHEASMKARTERSVKIQHCIFSAKATRQKHVVRAVRAISGRCSCGETRYSDPRLRWGILRQIHYCLFSVRASKASPHDLAPSGVEYGRSTGGGQHIAKLVMAVLGTVLLRESPEAVLCLCCERHIHGWRYLMRNSSAVGRMLSFP